MYQNLSRRIIPKFCTIYNKVYKIHCNSTIVPLLKGRFYHRVMLIYKYVPLQNLPQKIITQFCTIYNTEHSYAYINILCSKIPKKDFHIKFVPCTLYECIVPTDTNCTPCYILIIQ